MAGVQDAYNPDWTLASIVSGQATRDLIDSYEAERRPTDQAIVQSGDEAYARMMPSGTDALPALCGFLSTPGGQVFAALAESEIALGYDHSPVVEEVGQRRQRPRRSPPKSAIGSETSMA